MGETMQQTQTEWEHLALTYPQTHPQTGQQISEYTSMYGKPADSPETTPWCYQQNPTTVTPQSWTAPVHVTVGQYYDPSKGQVFVYSTQPNNPYDPTQMTPRPTLYDRQ